MTVDDPINFLLVDDLEPNLLALEALLKRDGLNLLKARTGPQALELLLQHEVALAFLDVQMPGMDGFELAEIMRSTDRTRRVPIIFLTAGLADQQRRIRGYETGAVDFLFKPIESDVLLNKADVFFDLARQRKELREAQAKVQQTNEQLAQRVRALARADRSKDEFLAMLAHELRNPLAPLRNAGEILKTDQLAPEVRDHALGILARQIDNMSRMIDDLLDVSRITEGKIELRRQQLDLRHMLQAAADVARLSCGPRGQTLRVSIPDDPLPVYADATRLEQIFGNLLGNASKYGGEGCEIALTVSVDPGTRQAVVSVRDNGIGIAPELLPHIFDLFVQDSRTLDRSHGGLGIGLTLVRKLVLLHGGTVEAHSEGTGRGSEFVVRLPILAQSPAPQDKAPAKSSEQSRRILIVDDNADAAQSLAILQNRKGHVTRTAYTGLEAVAAAADFSPEVVLLDIGLPGMDGYEVARRIRQIPSTADTFLVAMSGYGSEKDRAVAKDSGFDEYMVKPVNLPQLSEWFRTRV